MSSSFSWSLTIDTSTSSSGTPLTPAQLSGESAYRDLAVDEDGDIYLDENGDLAGVSGLEGIASDLRARLETFLGEYQWDTEIGVPYRQEILGEKPTRSRVEEIFRTECLACPGIVEVVQLQAVRSARDLTVTMRLGADLGAMIAATLVVTQQEEN